MSIILGVRVKLEKWGEYSAKVWLASSAIVMKKFISVEEGSENSMGMLIG